MLSTTMATGTKTGLKIALHVGIETTTTHFADKAVVVATTMPQPIEVTVKSNSWHQYHINA